MSNNVEEPHGFAMQLRSEPHRQPYPALYEAAVVA